MQEKQVSSGAFGTKAFQMSVGKDEGHPPFPPGHPLFKRMPGQGEGLRLKGEPPVTGRPANRSSPPPNRPQRPVC